MEQMRLAGRRTFVSGASSGIGKAIARRFLEEGAAVTGCGRRPSCGIEHPRYAYVSADLGSYDEAVRAVDAAASGMGGLDIVVNSAAIMAEGTLESTAGADFLRMLEVNVGGVFNVCKAAAPLLRAAGKAGAGAAIVNIASDLGVRPIPGRIAYCPSKAAVIMLTRCVALELAPYVRANTILPGLVETPMIRHRFEESADPAALRRAMEELYPLRRLGSTDDMAAAAVYLACAESAFMTGSELSVCGGSLI